ncbi:MAG: selenium-dependent molybdenum cofactor biosynthesis protein YqeB [Actinomycetota bacterium]
MTGTPADGPTAAPPDRPLCLLRGGGDLATGVAWRLTRAGWPVVVCELAAPLTVRRTVALSTAVTDGIVDVEGLVGRRVDDGATAAAVAATGDVPVLIAPELPDTATLAPDVVIDARLAKRPLDTTIDDAPLVVALGPGFTAGVDCHAVVETKRGHHLGRVWWEGSAAPDTGTPGTVGGRGRERVLRAPADGTARWQVAIGDRVVADQPIGTVAGAPVVAPFDGVVRGLIAESVEVTAGLKIGDVDPRVDLDATHDQISDKALAVGGGVVEAVLTWLAGERRPSGR